MNPYVRMCSIKVVTLMRQVKGEKFAESVVEEAALAWQAPSVGQQNTGATSNTNRAVACSLDCSGRG